MVLDHNWVKSCFPVSFPMRSVSIHTGKKDEVKAGSQSEKALREEHGLPRQRQAILLLFEEGMSY